MAEPTAEEPLVVVGAGLAGSLMALNLAKRGYFVDIYERRPDSRVADFVGGRSINLALSTRGLAALAHVGLEDEILERCIPMHGRMIHMHDGALTLQPYGKKGQYINSVERRHLNEVLINAADEHERVNFKFNHKLVDLDLDDGSPVFKDETNKTVEVKTRYLFGADGAYSSVRSELQVAGRFNYEQEYLPHGYKELTIPPGPDGTWLMEKNALHIWPREDFMLIALPNLDGSFTVTLFLSFEGKNAFENLRTPVQITEFFEAEFPDAVPLMPTLVQDFEENPTGSLVTIRCSPYHSTDQLLLLGDAAHAIVPFYGQGMNAAFEDCRLIDELIEDVAPNWGELGRRFSDERKDDADAIADLAMYNFIEMRSKVSDAKFVWRKKIEKKLHRWFPSWWVPLYSMVTFTNMPYAEAQFKAREQDRFLNQTAWFLAVVVATLCVALLVFLMRG